VLLEPEVPTVEQRVGSVGDERELGERLHAGGSGATLKGLVRNVHVSRRRGAGMTEPSTESIPGEHDRERGPDEAFCRNCGSVIAAQAEICPDCGVRQRDPPKSGLDAALEGGNPFLAALCSAVFPGLGQIYNRELKKGLLVIVASFGSGLLVLAFVGILLFPIVWLYAVWDAYTVAASQQLADDGTRD
jgi:TM2 domain-containing membrane protein YozV